MVFSVGALITGFTTLSCFPAVRMYLSEQFPTALRGRGHFFGESFGRIFAGVIVPFVMVSHTASPTIFFGTMIVMVLIGACIPFTLGRETLGQLESFTEVLPSSPDAAPVFSSGAGDPGPRRFVADAIERRKK